jgi:hypothetical protein
MLSIEYQTGAYAELCGSGSPLLRVGRIMRRANDDRRSCSLTPFIQSLEPKAHDPRPTISERRRIMITR